MNGYLLGNLNLVIEISNEPTIELIEPVKDEPNPRSTALIRKSSTGELVKHTRVFVPVSQVPSACLLLKNVFNKTEEIEYDPINWMKLLELEIYNEVVKYGEVSRIIVDVDSESYVYVMFETIEACGDALDKLDGRFFAGRQISACYFQENTFLSKFGSLL